MTRLSILTPAYELNETFMSLEIKRSFIMSILYEAYDRDDQEQVAEFQAKLDEVNKEIKNFNIPCIIES